MPRRKQPKPDPKPGYTFADLLVLTDATKSNLTHWTKLGIIKAGVSESDGRGYPSIFSPLNVIETQLAVMINRFHVHVDVIARAMSYFKHFHRSAVAIYEVQRQIPFTTATRFPPLFESETIRWHYANDYIASYRFDKLSVEAANKRAYEISGFWHRVRESSLNRGVGDRTLSDFLGLFIADAESDPAMVEIDLNPPAKELHNLIADSAIVVDLASVVFRVGEHCKRCGDIPLGAW